MSRLDSRAFRWYGLCVPPQRELVVSGILGREGFATFVPTRREYRFRSHTARVQKRRTAIEYPLMPRYVFAGMSDSTPSWHGIFKYRIVTSVISQDGKPYLMPHGPLWDLMQKWSKGKFSAPESQRYMYRGEFKAGDRVVTDVGFEGKVMKLNSSMARIWIEIFGSYREIDVDIESLAAA